MAEPAWRPVAGGVLVDVRLTPRGGAEALDGVVTLADGRSVLAARVRAAPEGGKANEALLRLLARELGLPASACTLQAGAKNRLKRVALAGHPQGVCDRLDALVRAAKD